MLVFCPYCGSVVNGYEKKINACTNCKEYFVPVKAFCMLTGQDLTSLGANVAYGSRTTYADGAAMLYSSNQDYKCDNCSQKTGVRSFRDAGVLPFSGYYIVKLKRFSGLIYHGTKSKNLDSIARSGLLPPASELDKTQGFPTEGKLRYAGIDLAPAKHHGEVIVELDFSGWIAVLDIPYIGETLNYYLSKLPPEVCGIEYIEFGRSLALTPQAVVLVRDPERYMDAAQAPRRERFCQKLRACALWRYFRHGEQD
ncbi:hypothetical protein ACTMQT_12205 [Pseudomonas syringae pv. aptata]|uniref:hypothetical protein n=1 Tax=Pseudomonas syringae TaxID=317 RepID=UPI003F895F75